MRHLVSHMPSSWKAHFGIQEHHRDRPRQHAPNVSGSIVRPRPAVNRSLLAAIALIPLLAGSILAMAARYDGLYGQDAFAYYDYAVGALRASLLNLAPPPPFFWPPGYPLLVALVSLVVGPIPIAGQIVSLVASALVPLFTGLLAGVVYGNSGRSDGGFVAAMAALIAALTPQLWQSAMVTMADTSALAAATMGVWALATYGQESKPARWLVLASCAIAWAVLTRWSYALVALPCVVYALLVVARRAAWRDGIVAAAAAIVILAPVLAPALSFLLQADDSAIPFIGDLQVYSWSPLNALRNEFFTADGRLSYRFANGVYYALAPARQFFFTPLLAVFILPGIYIAVRDRSHTALLLIVAWAGMVYAFHAGAPWQNFRFTLAYLPPLAILVAVGIAEMRRKLTGQRWLVNVAVVFGLLVMVVSGVSLSQDFL